MRRAVVFVLVAAWTAVATPALAQSVSSARVAATVTAGFEGPFTSFTQSVTFEQFSEAGSLTSVYAAAWSPSIDAGATVRVWRGLGVGVAGAFFRDHGSADVTAMVPNPLATGEPRRINGPAGLTHAETTVHLEAAYWIPVNRRVMIILVGGPSIFHATQDFVSDVTYTQEFPYTTATYQSATVVREKKTASGYNVGGEAGWLLWRNLSLVGALRFSHASASFTDVLADPVALGGLHAGGGVRVVF